jgi:lipopolysaccharide assembly outer membrane protein LptD (OstA)
VNQDSLNRVDAIAAMRKFSDVLLSYSDSTTPPSVNQFAFATNEIADTIEKGPTAAPDQEDALTTARFVQGLQRVNTLLTNLRDSTEKFTIDGGQSLIRQLSSPLLSEAIGKLAIGTLFLSSDPPDAASLLDDLQTMVSNRLKNIAIREVLQSDQLDMALERSSKKGERYDVLRQTYILWGEAVVKYGDITLEAENIELNFASNTVLAFGAQDSTGKWYGKPVFKEKAMTYYSDTIRYNFETKKGLISNIITEQGDGIIRSEVVKKTGDDALYMANNVYTTCNLEHPHYGIRAPKLKTVVNKHVISGPAVLEIADVPLPLFLPFGMFPATNKRASGLVIPQYGESREQGFFLREGGFYWAVNDYLGLKLTGDIFSLGGWRTSLNGNYRKRYSYSGSFSLSSAKAVFDNPDGLRENKNDYNVRWTHTPETRGSSRFSANVNAGTSTFNRNNSTNLNDFVAPTLNSSINYSKSFGDRFNFSSSLRHQQNVPTNPDETAVIQLNPDFSFNMQQVLPFENIRDKSGALKKLSIAYTGSARTRISNYAPQNGFNFTTVDEVLRKQRAEALDVEVETDTLDFVNDFTEMVSRSAWGVSHVIPISTNVNIFKYFNLSPSISYQESWFTNRYSYTWVDSLAAVKVDTTNAFTRMYEFSASANVNTNIYGMYAFKSGAMIRHTIQPSIGLSWRPDFTNPFFNMFEEVQTDESGRTAFVPVATNGNSRAPGTGRSATINFSLNNQLELKKRVEKDSAKFEEVKKMLIQQLGFSGSYNFLADSQQLSNLSIRLITEPIKGLPLRFNATYDPYLYVPQQVGVSDPSVVPNFRSSRLAVGSGTGNLGTLTAVQVGTSLSLQPGKKTKATRAAEDLVEESAEEVAESAGVIERSDGLTADEMRVVADIVADPYAYIDFNIPWSLRLNYNFNYSNTPTQALSSDSRTRITQQLSFNGDLSITERMKLTFSSGYDFVNKGISMTRIGLARDLHCWQMNLDWVPFGDRQSYSFEIAVKSAILQDLKLNKRNSWQDRPTSNAFGR